MPNQVLGNQGLLGNPLFATLPPDQQQSLIQLQQQQAVGQNLLGQGLSPIDTSNRQVGGMAYHVSPFEGISKLVNAYVGNKLSMDSLGQQAQITSQAVNGQFGQDQQQPVGQSGAPVQSSMDSGALTGPTAGMNGMQGTPTPQQVGVVLSGNGIATPTATTTQVGPMTLPGHTAAQSRGLYVGMGPDEYGKLRAQYEMPTDATRMALAAGLSVSDANAGALFKSNYVAPNQFGSNATIQDPRTGQMFTTPSAAPAGYQNQQLPDGNWSTVPTQGGPQAIQGEAAARAAGAAQFSVRPGVDPTTGRPVFNTDYNLATGALPPGSAGGLAGSSSSGKFGGYQAPNTAATAPSLPPGASDLAAGSAQAFNTLRTQAATTPSAIDGYNKAEQELLTGVQTGPGSTFGTNIIGKLNTAGIPILKGDATGYQSLQKFLSNANAQAAAASGYSGSDSRFDAFSHGQPNAETLNPDAARYAIEYVRGQQLGVQAKYQAAQSFINSQGNSTVNYPQFEAQWNKVYNPDVAMVKAMPNPADQNQYLQTLKQQGKLGQWMKSYQQMQQMGAF